MKVSGKLLIFACTASFIGLQGYIYEVKILHKWDSSRRQDHYFLGFSDFHDKSHTANEKQRPVIESLLKTLDKDRYKILVEDLCSGNSNGTTGCSTFQMASKGGILAGLGDFCRNHNIPFENVEYRYCRVATMGPVINNLNANPHLFLSTRSITVGSVMDEIEKTMGSIQKRTTSPVVKKAYNEEAHKVRILFDKLQFNKHREISIADYLRACSTDKNKVDVLKHLLTFDSGLLDIKMAQEVLYSKDKRYIVAFAGGTHINNVCKLLQKAGYSEVKNTSIAYKKVNDISQCLGSNVIDGAFCIKPQPLDSTVIKECLSKQIKH